MAHPQSSSSSFTVKPDLESQQQPRNRVPHWSLVTDPAGVTDAVLNHAYPGHGTPDSPYVVDFLPEDDSNPLQYPQHKKWAITLLQALATLAVAFASTAYSGGVFEVIRYFGVSTTVATLGVSLFVLGFAVGPLLWAPLSEFYGRQIVFFLTYMALTAFNAGAAAAQNIETLIVLRFFAGAFGASPLTNSGGVIADMFDAKGACVCVSFFFLFLSFFFLFLFFSFFFFFFLFFLTRCRTERGKAAGVFAMAPFLGPSIGPIVGGFLVCYPPPPPGAGPQGRETSGTDSTRTTGRG